jgi:hypothetical protein
MPKPTRFTRNRFIRISCQDFEDEKAWALAAMAEGLRTSLLGPFPDWAGRNLQNVAPSVAPMMLSILPF